MINFKRDNNKGIVLITTFMVATVAVVFSGAYISATLVQSSAVGRQKANLQAFYAAEKGIEYAFTELKYKNWDWLTHNVGADNALEKINPPPVSALFPTVSPFNATTGCYEITTSLGNIEVKTYQEPASGSVFILSRSTTADNFSARKILRFKVSRRSLYDYFIFTPYNFSAISVNGTGSGAIHANKNIVLGSGVNINNVTELSAAGFVRYNYEYRVPAYLLDGLDGVIDGHAPEPNENSSKREWSSTDYTNWYNNLTAVQQGKAVGPPSGNLTPGSPTFASNYPWLKLGYNYMCSNCGYTWHPNWGAISSNWSNLAQNFGESYSWNETKASYDGSFAPYSTSPPFSNNATGNNFTTYRTNYTNLDPLFGSGAKVNGVSIPQKLTAQEYAYDQFYPDPYLDGGTDGCYTATLPTVYYTNSELQREAWAEAINSSSAIINTTGQPHFGEHLSAVLKERNTGGIYLIPPEAEEDYFKGLANSTGIYIKYDGTVANRADLPVGIITTSTFYNHFRPYQPTNTTYTTDKVVNVDVAELKTWAESGGVNFNGVIYYEGCHIVINQGVTSCSDEKDRGIRLKNAGLGQLPEGGLTVYSTRQVYLQGDFNYNSTRNATLNDADWQPAAVITPNIPYFLSSAFGDGPQSLPNCTHNINYSFVNDTEAHYTWGQNLPNQVAGNVTYRVSLVSPRVLFPDYILERWREGQSGANYRRVIIGANVRIEGNITFVPPNYNRGRAWPGDPPYLTDYTGAVVFKYDPKLEGKTPPGDFLGGSEQQWQELPASENNFSHHT